MILSQPIPRPDSVFRRIVEQRERESREAQLAEELRQQLARQARIAAALAAK